MNSRRGSILIVVVGLSVMLLSLLITYLGRIQTSGSESRTLLSEAQARIMLTAALMYLQESSRLGWSSEAVETVGATTIGWRGDPAAPISVSAVRDTGGETYGWTDVRTGWLGPLGARDAASEAIPVPRWWTRMTSRPYVPLADDADLPPPAERQWPCPGAVVRCPVQRLERPPYAIMGLGAPNPLRPADAVPGVSGFDTSWGARNPATLVYGPDYIGALDPQPASGADTWAAFAAGNPLPIDSTSQTAWFRIYRELLADHDNDGIPAFDRVAITDPGHQVRNWNIFIIAVGAGGTRGYRRYEDAPSGLFIDRRHFTDLRAAERIAWYRVEWSAQSGGSWDAQIYGRGGIGAEADQQADPTAIADATARSFGGSFSWIQRLDQEPPVW